MFGLITVITSFLSSFICCGSACLPEMTLEEKVGQLLMVHFHGEEANEDAKFLIQDLHVGAIIYYKWANGLHCPKQVKALSSNLQTLALQNRMPIPLFIAVDQEGGRVCRLTNGFTPLPSQKEMSEKTPAFVEKCAFITGQELAEVGINVNLAPVVDINNNKNNPVIGDRSFGDSAEIVIAYARQAIQGYHRAGMFTCLKHFPGHGNVSIDSHTDLPILEKSRKQLEAVELAPFFCLANESEMVMTAHISVPAIDPVYCATLSENILNILRREIGFSSIIISDSLIMAAATKQCTSIEEVAVRALEAGCDLLLLGGKHLHGFCTNSELTIKDIEGIVSEIVKAVQIGRISEEKINRSIDRILQLKSRIIAF